MKYINRKKVNVDGIEFILLKKEEMISPPSRKIINRDGRNRFIIEEPIALDGEQKTDEKVPDTDVAIENSTITEPTKIVENKSISDLSNRVDRNLIQSQILNVEQTKLKISNLSVVFDGGGAVITTGTTTYIPIPFNAEILEATLLADRTGTVQFDIWKTPYSAYPPTDSNSITGPAPLMISGTSMSANTYTTFSAWTTIQLFNTDVVAFSVDSAATIQKCTVSLKLKRI